jgi:glycine betaine/choline ABC-type transport system substrate-binding protein
MMDDYTVYSNRYSEISVMGEILLIDNPEIQELKKHVNRVQKEMELKQELNYQISIGGRIYQ